MQLGNGGGGGGGVGGGGGIGVPALHAYGVCHSIRYKHGGDDGVPGSPSRNTVLLGGAFAGACGAHTMSYLEMKSPPHMWVVLIYWSRRSGSTQTDALVGDTENMNIKYMLHSRGERR